MANDCIIRAVLVEKVSVCTSSTQWQELVKGVVDEILARRMAYFTGMVGAKDV